MLAIRALLFALVVGGRGGRLSKHKEYDVIQQEEVVRGGHTAMLYASQPYYASSPKQDFAICQYKTNRSQLKNASARTLLRVRETETEARA